MKFAGSMYVLSIKNLYSMSLALKNSHLFSCSSCLKKVLIFALADFISLLDVEKSHFVGAESSNHLILQSSALAQIFKPLAYFLTVCYFGMALHIKFEMVNNKSISMGYSKAH